MKTLDYLIDNLLSTLPDSEGFVWDRMRSIRQDFTYQNYCGPEAVDCNERIVRIHLLIIHVMVKAKVEFSLQQELEQLHKSLITLSEIYDDVRASGGSCPNEAEFRAYALLSKIRDPQYDKNIQEMPSHIFQDDLVQMALCFRRIISNSNFSERGFVRTENCLNFYSQFFKLIQSNQVPFLMASFLEIYLNEIRFYALKALSLTMNKKHKPIMSEMIADELMFNNMDELMEFCTYYSITTTPEGVDMKSVTAHSHKLPEKKPLKNFYLQCVDDKLGNIPYPNVINIGKPNIDTIDNKNHAIPGAVAVEENTRKMNTIPPVTIPTLAQPSGIPVTNINNAQKPVAPPPQMSMFKPQPVNSLNNPSMNSGLQQPSILGGAGENNVNAPSTTFGFNPINNTNKSLIPDKTPSLTDSLFGTGSVSPLSDIHTPVKNSKPMNSMTASSFNVVLPKATEKPASAVDDSKKKKEKLLEEAKKKEQQLQLQKEERKRKQKEQVTADIANSIIRKVVKSNCENIIQDNLKNQKQRSNIIDSLAEELYGAFIHEKVYLLFLNTRADNQRNHSLSSRFLQKWKLKLNKKQKQEDYIKKRKQELLNVEKQLGVPSVSKTKLLLKTPIADKNVSFLLSSSLKNNKLYSPVTNESNQFSQELLHKQGPLWKPLDIRRLYFENILSKYANKKSFSSDIFLYSKNWNSISSSWILNKFDVKDVDSTVKVASNGLSLNIRCIDDKYNPTNFTDTQLLVFNTGVTDDHIFDLEMKLQQDGEDLIKLVTGIAMNTNINFNLLIIYWESSETQLKDSTISKLLKLNRIDRNFSEVLENIGFVKINEVNPGVSLEKGLKRISQSYEYKLTDRGRYHELLKKKRNQRVSSQEKQLKITKSIDEKMATMLEADKIMYRAEQSRNDTYAHLENHIAASPKARKRKLPILVSETKSSKFRTPMGSRMRHTSYSSMGSSQQQQSHLAMKVMQPTTRITSQHGPLPSGTPSHSTNLPSHTYEGHVLPSFGSSQGNNSSMRNVSSSSQSRMPGIFNTPSNAILNEDAPHSPPPPPDRRSTDLQELKSLIESVKKKVNR